jgi:hypothetical protein
MDGVTKSGQNRNDPVLLLIVEGILSIKKLELGNRLHDQLLKQMRPDLASGR